MPTNMATSYCLYCTVCESEYEKKEWLPHLLQDKHQNRARSEVIRSWGNPDGDIKKCVLVAFSSFPVAVDDSLLQYFSKDTGTMVTDFVWWKERPRLGYVQFESSAKLDKVFESLRGSAQIWIDGSLVEVKKAVDLLELEWRQFLPPEADGNIANDNISNDGLTPNDATFNVDYDEIIDGPFFTMKTGIRDIVASQDPGKNTWNKKLNAVYLGICRDMKICKKDWEQSVWIMQQLREVLSSMFPQYPINSVKLCFFRNMFLRTKSTGSNTLLIYAYKDVGLKNPDRFITFGVSVESSIGTQSHILPHLEKVNGRPAEVASAAYLHAPSGLTFELVTNPTSIVEVQACRLFKYLCTFDSRVFALFTLTNYWGKVNHITMSRDNLHKVVSCSYTLPEPSAFQWLPMLFLCHEGIVPSPRKIMEREHKPLLLFSSGLDVGFDPDPLFAKNWSDAKPPAEDFIPSVLHLLVKYFTFCTKLHPQNASPCILNSKDGEVLDRDKVLQYHPIKSADLNLVTALSPEEVETVQQGMRKSRDTTKQFYMLNPMNVTWQLSICDEKFANMIIPAMEKTRKKLQEFLDRKDGNLKETLTLT